jgi:hypothetical protein
VRQDPLCFLSGTSRNRRTNGQTTAGNQVQPEAILNEWDVRTTIMIRNIPNKFQAFELSRLLRLVSHGRVTFSYLRVDFNNRCNVGYAFVDLLTPADIIPIYNLLAGAKWNIYNSDKVAAICYATIKGRECLTERFRNSGVMTQWAPFRAKLWWNDDDVDSMESPHLLGTVAEFTRSNNHVKLQRSLDNAFHVGLFPPNPRDPNSRNHIDEHDRHLDNRDPAARRPLAHGTWCIIDHPSQLTGPLALVPSHASIIVRSNISLPRIETFSRAPVPYAGRFPRSPSSNY